MAPRKLAAAKAPRKTTKKPTRKQVSTPIEPSPIYTSVMRSLAAKYDAAQTTDLNSEHWSMSDGLSADTANSHAVRKKLRERARYEVANNCYAKGIIRTHANAIVGTGPRLQVLTADDTVNEIVEAKWRRWVESIGLAEKLRTLWEAKIVDGEGFLFPWTDNQREGVQLNVRGVECDQVQTPDLQSWNTRNVDGMEIDEQGRVLRYHLLKRHPGDLLAGPTIEYDRVPASMVIHVYKSERPNQHRGIPEITPSLPLFAIFRRYTHATLLAAETAAAHALFLRTQSGAAEASELDAWEAVQYRHNAATILPDGWEPFQMDAKQPTNTYAGFKREIVAEIARCLNMPYNIAAADSSGHNYSSGRLDHQVYGKEIQIEQDYAERTVLNRLFELWRQEAEALGEIPLIGSTVSHSWHWDPLEDIDPQKTQSARADALKTGMTSFATEYAADGRDWRTEFATQAKCLGMTFDQYQKMITRTLFPDTAGGSAATSIEAEDNTPVAEFGGLSRRQWQNNRKAIHDVLDELIIGDVSEPMAKIMLESLGLTRDKCDSLIEDATASGSSADMIELNAAGKRPSIQLAGLVKLDANNESTGKPIEILVYTGGQLHVEGFALPVVIDLAGLQIKAQRRPILIDHEQDIDSVLGQTDAISVDLEAGRIVATGTVHGTSERSQRVIDMARSGYEWQASIGAMIEEQQLVPAGQTVEVNGRDFEGPVIVARRSTYRDVSVVATGADDNTAARIAAAGGQGDTMPTFEEWLASLGFDAATLSETQLAGLQEAYNKVTEGASDAEPVEAMEGEEDDDLPEGMAAKVKAMIRAAMDGEDDEEKPVEAGRKRGKGGLDSVQQMRIDAANEQKRIRIVSARAKDHPEIAQKAIAEGWTSEKTELAVLRASRPQGPNLIFRNHDNKPQVLEAALAMAGGLRDVEKLYPEQVLDVADRQYAGAFGIKSLLIECASKAGQNFSPLAFKANHRQILKAAFSAADVSGILSNVANKFLLQGWNSVESGWEQISSTRSVQDFKQSTSYRLTSTGTWEQVGNGGELKHGQLAEDSYTNQAKTYGQILAITRQMQINDDLGALSDIPRMLGRKAALTLAKTFWTTFLGATFFTTGNNNYFEGAGTTLGTVGQLDLAVQKFRKQTDSEGNPLGVEPKFLLVPPELEVTAQELFVSTNINTGGAATKEKVPNANVHQSKYKPIISSYLSNSSYTGYSATAWYLLADPADISTIEVAFLNGQRTPTIETAEADFDTLGIQTRAYFDFGVALQEYRAGVKSKGAA